MPISLDVNKDFNNTRQLEKILNKSLEPENSAKDLEGVDPDDADRIVGSGENFKDDISLDDGEELLVKSSAVIKGDIETGENSKIEIKEASTVKGGIETGENSDIVMGSETTVQSDISIGNSGKLRMEDDVILKGDLETGKNGDVFSGDGVNLKGDIETGEQASITTGSRAIINGDIDTGENVNIDIGSGSELKGGLETGEDGDIEVGDQSTLKGDIETGNSGNFEAGKDSSIKGDVETGESGNITIESGSEVKGDLEASGTVYAAESASLKEVDGEVKDISKKPEDNSSINSKDEVVETLESGDLSDEEKSKLLGQIMSGGKKVHGEIGGGYFAERKEFPNKIISGYGTELEFLGKGTTSEYQEVKFRFRPQEGDYSYLAVSREGLRNVSAYVTENRSSDQSSVDYVIERNYLENEKVENFSNFHSEWRRGNKNIIPQIKSQKSNTDLSSLSTDVVPEKSVLYRIENPANSDWTNVEIKSSSDLSYTVVDPAGGSSEYSPGFSAPYCDQAESPCVANSSLLKSRDDLPTPEPNSPNTIDSATDGTKGDYQKDSSVENITVESLDSQSFSSGHQVQVETYVYCKNKNDISFAYTSNASNPSWQLQEVTACPGGGGGPGQGGGGSNGPYKLSTTFQTGTGDLHAFRVVAAKDFNTAQTEGVGDEADNDDLVIRFDNTAPTISLNSPSNQSTFRSGELLNFSITDGLTGLKEAKYSLDGAPNQSFSEPHDIDTWMWEEGQRELDIYAEDRAGNLRSKTYNFQVDNTPPQIDILSPDQQLYGKKNITLDYLVTDSSFVEHFYRINNSRFTGNSGIREVYPGDLIAPESPVENQLTDHEVDFFLEQGSNAAGNSLGYISVDYGFADVNLSQLDSSDFFVGLDTDQDGTVEQNATSDITSLTKSGNSFTLNFGGNYNLNAEDTLIVSYKDVRNPSQGEYTVNVDLNGDETKTGELQTFSSVSDSQIEVEEVQGATNVSAVEGWNRLEFFSLDDAGNLNSTSVEFEVDVSRPVIELMSPSNNSKVEKGNLIDLSATDANLDTVQYSLNGGPNRTDFVNDYDIDTSDWNTGENELTVYANDTLGYQRSRRYIFNITGYDTPPSINLNRPENNSVINGFSIINFTISDPDMYAAYHSIEGAAYSVDDFVGTYDLNLSRSQAGVFDLKIKAKDQELIRPESPDPNVTTRHLVNFYVEPGSNAAGSSLDDLTVNYGWDSDVNLSKLDTSDFFVGLDNTNNGVVDQNVTGDITGLQRPDSYSFRLELGGNYNVQEDQNILVRYDDVINPSSGEYFTDVDVNGNSEKTEKLKIAQDAPEETVNINQYSFTVDNTRPVLDLFSPENRIYGQKDVWLNYSSADAHLDETFYRLNSGPVNLLSGNTTVTAQEGLNTLELAANDSAGNSRTVRRNFTVDTTPPDINVQKPENTTYFQKGIILSVSLDEKGSQCSYSLDGSDRESMSKVSDNKFERQVIGLDYGSHRANFLCRDLAGNQNQTSNITFTLEEAELRYEPDFRAPYCASGDSPCDVNESFLISRDNLGTSEPNSPNTIDQVTDGQKGRYQKDASIDSVFLKDYTAKTFSDNHTLEVSTTAYCSGGNDVVNTVFAENVSDPNWQVKSSNTCQGSGFQTFRTNITLSGTGDVAVRNLIERKADATTTAATSDWGDNDDVVLPLDRKPPVIELVSHENNTLLTQNDTLSFQFLDPEFNFDTGMFSVDGGGNQSLNGTELDVSVLPEGERSITVYGNDTAGNYNSSNYRFTVDNRPPMFRNLSQNATLLNRSETVELSAEVRDGNNLSSVTLATDETGSFEKKSVYGSPQQIQGGNVWKKAAFNWQNSSIFGEKVRWRLYANDTAGRTAVSPIKSFKVPNSSLEIEANGTRPVEDTVITEPVEFTANYTDRLSGGPINGSNVGCNVEFENAGYNMQLGYDDGDGLYSVEKSFDTSGNYSYTISCNGSAQDYTPLEKTGEVEVKYIETDVNVEGLPESFKASYHRNVSFNTTIECRDANCAGVNAEIRYNGSSSSPDTALSQAGTPFRVYSSNPKSCNLSEGEKCTVNWTVNVTGQIGDVYSLDVNSAIDQTDVKNSSTRRELEIGEYYMTELGFGAVDFGVLDPGEENKPAKQNDQSGYNLSVRSYSNQPLNLWVRSTDLQSQDFNNYSIPAENISYSTTNSVSQAVQLSQGYQNLKKQLSAGDSFDTFYWVDVPYGIYYGEYRGKLYFKSNSTAQ